MQQPKPSIVFLADRIRLSVYAAKTGVAAESLAVTIERNQSGSETGWYPTATLRGDDLHAMAKALHDLMLTLSTANNGKGPVLGEPKRPLSVSVKANEDAGLDSGRDEHAPSPDATSETCEGSHSSRSTDADTPATGAASTTPSSMMPVPKRPPRASEAPSRTAAKRRAAIAKGRSR